MPPSARSQLSVMPSNLPITVNNCACQRFPSSIERKPRHVRANVHKEMISLTRRGWSQWQSVGPDMGLEEIYLVRTLFYPIF